MEWRNNSNCLRGQLVENLKAVSLKLTGTLFEDDNDVSIDDIIENGFGNDHKHSNFIMAALKLAGAEESFPDPAMREEKLYKKLKAELMEAMKEL